MRFVWTTILLLSAISLYVNAQTTAIVDDRVIFHDDFGGNDPKDPLFYTGSTPNIVNYSNSGGEHLHQGEFVITKKGYDDNGKLHLQDDYTYFGDFSRGYFLEIYVDNSLQAEPFYQVRIDNLEKYIGQPISISYCVANVRCLAALPEETAANSPTYCPSIYTSAYNVDNQEFIRQIGTAPISMDEVISCEKSASWFQYSGTINPLPPGISAIDLLFYGRDQHLRPGERVFAIDDIDVRWAVPQVTVTGLDTVCVGTKNIFAAHFENHNYLQEPIVYQWLFSSDSLNWEPVPEGEKTELKLKALPHHSGWYRMMISGMNTDGTNQLHLTSDPFKLYVIEDCPPVQCADGKLLFREDFGGESLNVSDVTAHEAIYSTTIEDVCAGSELSFFAHVSAERLLFRLVNPDTGEELAAYETGELQEDASQPSSQQHLAGMNYTVQEGVERIQLTIYNNTASTTGNTIIIHDVEIRLCLEPVTISAVTPACRKNAFTLEAQYDNYGILHSPEYQWSYSQDNVSWEILATGTGSDYSIPQVHKSSEGWYRVSVAETGNSNNPHCRTESEPFFLVTRYCNTAVTQSVDTAVCDTLLPLTWRAHEWYGKGSFVDTIKDLDDDDSVHLVLSLDTFFCERLYPLIVNKYNWQLLCDNEVLRRLFPDQTALTFQWFKDGEAVPGATEDDYSEQNELHGSYQLVIRLSDGSYVWSTIVEILDTPEPAPVRVQIYDSRGMPVRENQVTYGIYLYRYEQGGRVWTEKKLIQ